MLYFGHMYNHLYHLSFDQRSFVHDCIIAIAELFDCSRSGLLFCTVCGLITNVSLGLHFNTDLHFHTRAGTSYILCKCVVMIVFLGSIDVS